MLKSRVIPCLDVDAGRVVKGENFLNLRDAGDPAELAARYNEEGADELVFLDITASSDSRSTMLDVVKEVAEKVFIPLTVGGGIRSIEDMRVMLKAGADKVAVNTAAVKDSSLLARCSTEFGAQCVVLAIDARRIENPLQLKTSVNGSRMAEAPWEVCVRGGRTSTPLDPIKWARIGEQLGAGEILLTSMDTDGTRSGYDLPLLEAVTSAVNIPVIASGGAGTPEHLAEALKTGADAVLLASILHFGEYSIRELKRCLKSYNLPIRIDE